MARILFDEIRRSRPSIAALGIGFSVSRQLVQIRIGEPTSEEAKGAAWDKNRIFHLGRFATTENLLKAMAGTLRQAVPKLMNLSPTLAEALMEIESTIQKIRFARA